MPGSLPAFSVEAVDEESRLPRFAQFGGTVQPSDMQALAEKVLLSMFARG